jgi:glucosamine--fructose-6-phosphate aminotransferase (isomerizing)
LALISPAFLSIVLCPQDNFLEQNMNTIHEIKARNGVVYAISTQVQEKADKTLLMPQIHEVFYPLLETLILQLLSYYTAKKLGREIDKPRNLAKSVTVK